MQQAERELVSLRAQLEKMKARFTAPNERMRVKIEKEASRVGIERQCEYCGERFDEDCEGHLHGDHCKASGCTFCSTNDALKRFLAGKAFCSHECESKYIAETPYCRVCGCSEDDACDGGCYWVEDPEGLGDICSQCANKLPRKRRAIKVFRINEFEWWIGESLESCIRAAMGAYGLSREEVMDDPYELTPAQLKSHTFRDDLVPPLWLNRLIHRHRWIRRFWEQIPRTRSFAAQLRREIRKGGEFPRPFATTEY